MMNTGEKKHGEKKTVKCSGQNSWFCGIIFGETPSFKFENFYQGFMKVTENPSFE